jgi:hypothetical protein
MQEQPVYCVSKFHPLRFVSSRFHRIQTPHVLGTVPIDFDYPRYNRNRRLTQIFYQEKVYRELAFPRRFCFQGRHLKALFMPIRG